MCDSGVILRGEIRRWSLLGAKGLREDDLTHLLWTGGLVLQVQCTFPRHLTGSLQSESRNCIIHNTSRPVQYRSGEV